MTATRAILHIGTEKTGTTALQDTFVAHRDELAGRGFFYSAAAGGRSHVRLAAYAADDDRRDALRRKLAIDTAEDLARFRDKLAGSLAEEVDANPGKVFLYSNEHCHSRLVSQASVDRLAALLKPLFDEIVVVVYLRRQDELAVSRYSTMLKAGGTGTSILSPASAHYPFYDYWGLCRRWMRAFGDEQLVVRRFEAGRLAGGSIVTDFCETLGLPALAEPAERANESLKPEYQAFLRAMNARLPRRIGGALNPDRGDLDQIVYDLGRGRGARPARAAAEAFYAAYAEGNEQVRARFFPDDATLFEEDFSHYPETEEARDFDAEQAIDVTAAIWREAMAERRRLRGEIATLRAQIRAPAASRGPAARPPSLDDARDAGRDDAAPTLFQYWNTDARPAVVDALMQGWARDADFAYAPYTRDTALAMIRDRFDERTAATFERCKAPAMQADLFRLCALHAFGGVYIDADIENLGDNAFLLHREGRGFLFHRRGNLANDVIVVHEPGDPAIAFALGTALYNIETNTGANVWAMTGPGILTAEFHRRGADDPLFAGFRFGDVADVGRRVTFHWNLDYKSTEADWRRIAASDLIAPSD